MTSTAYLLGNEWHLARQRLTLLEAAFDAESIGYLTRLGIHEDWHCLDVGAGGGSIASWLSTQVGPAGQTVATDIDIRLLAELDCPKFEIVRHDVVAEALPHAEFDLVHTRAVLCHLAERERALDHIADAVRPGGWVLVEEPDFVTEAIVANANTAAQATFRRVTRAKQDFTTAHGFDPAYGRRVFGELRARGFTDLAAQGRATITAGGSVIAQFFELSTQQMREGLVAKGQVSHADVDAYCELVLDPSYVLMWPAMFATWGRLPG